MFKRTLKANEIPSEELTLGPDSVCIWKKFVGENSEHAIIMVKIVDKEMGYAVYTKDNSAPYFDTQYEMTLYHIAAMGLLVDHRLLLAEISALTGKAAYYYRSVGSKSKRDIRPFTIDMLAGLKETVKELTDNGIKKANDMFKRQSMSSRPKRRFLGGTN